MTDKHSQQKTALYHQVQPADLGLGKTLGRPSAFPSHFLLVGGGVGRPETGQVGEQQDEKMAHPDVSRGTQEAPKERLSTDLSPLLSTGAAHLSKLHTENW